MPKYPTDKRRYYDEMSDGRAMSRSHSRGRPQDRDRDRDRDHGDDRSRSSSQQPYQSSRRPGQPPPQASSSYARPSTSSGPPRESYSGRREVRYTERAPSTFSDAESEAASVAGSTGESAAMGRGGMRGRRILPVDIITRPKELVTKHGGHGDPIELTANYFKLVSAPDWCLYQYRVDFEPEEDRKVVCKALLRQHKETLGAYIFDGTVLYTTNEYPEPLELSSERQSDQQMVLIKLRKVGDMTRGDHHYIQFFNIIMRKCLDYLQLQLVGRNYFDAKNKAEVKQYKLELWPGYITSIRQHEHDILMCAEITHKVMRNETLLDILSECYEHNPHEYKREFSHQVLGVVVLTDYNNNTYRVDDIDYEVSPSSTFKKKDGTDITYRDYYQEKYGIRIGDMSQPLLVSKSKPRDRRAGKAETVYLIPELCRSTGLTDVMRNNFQLMKALAQYTRVSPADRIDKLKNFNDRLYSVKQVVEEFKSWNLELEKTLIKVPARVMPCDRINYGNGISTNVPYDANWTKDLRDKHLVKCGRLDEWFLLVPTKFRGDCQSFVHTLTRVAQKMNFTIEEPYVIDMRDDNPATYANMLEQVKSQNNPMLIFCVASNNRGDRYSAIKKKCCVDRPVPTQVVLAKSLKPGKSQMSIATKVAIQMNCKIGGIPWSVSIPLQGLMVVGFDVCHDTNMKGKDFGAMVASLDVNFGRYYSAVSSHSSGEELSSDLSVNLCKALEQFKYYNSSLPKRIVIYRDGVGEGQIPFVVDHEVKEIKAKLQQKYENPNDIKLAYIIVTKKINTRFIATVINQVLTLGLLFCYYDCLTSSSTRYFIKMIEAPAWNLKKDETIYKAAGAAHLRKYGQFFDKLASQCCQNSTDLEHIIEGPLRLTYEVNEDISLLSLAETESKFFSKLLASIGGTCREIRLLKAEANEHYSKLFHHEEQCAEQADYKIESLLSDLQDLSMYTNRISTVIHLTVKQISNLASNKHREIYLPLLIEHLMDLFIILVTLDEVISGQTALIERWKVYRVKVRSVVHNASQLNMGEERIVVYEKLLKDLHAQLLSKCLFSKAVEHAMDIGKPSTMCDQMVFFLKSTLTDVESKVADSAAVNRSWILATVGLVVVAKLFGTCDKKLAKRLLEVSRKLYAVNLAGGVMWLPGDFLAEQLPREGLAPLGTEVGEKVLAARLQRLPAQLSSLAQRTMLWSAQMQRLQIKSGLELFAEIERKRELLLELLRLTSQLREAAELPTNLHALLLRPMSRTTVHQVCRLAELQRALQTQAQRLASTVVLSQVQALQQLTYQLLALLEGARATLGQRPERGYARERLDALALLGAAARLAQGPASRERRLLLRVALGCVSQLADGFREGELARLRRCLDAYDALAELQPRLREARDYSALLLQQRALLPAYLGLAREAGRCSGHLARLSGALGAARPGAEAAREQRELLLRHLLEPACRELETGLRLHAHAHLRLAVGGPFREGARDAARAPRSPALPLAGGRRLLRPRRFAEHYLDSTFYNLSSVAPHDWRAYRGMQALARHRLRLRAVPSLLPSQSLEQGLDALEVMRDIQRFVARYLYDLRAQTFMERDSAGRQLHTLGVRHLASGIRTHGSGIMSTSVNFVYQLLRVKLHALSQFLFDEHIKSRLARDLRFVRAQREHGAAAPYPYERAEKFQRGIRRLGVTPEGLSYLDRFRQLLAQIGNALGYVRLIRSAGLHASANAVSFLPEVPAAADAPALHGLCAQLSLNEGARAAAGRLDADIAHLVRNFTEGIHYFGLLVDVFAGAFRDPARAHHLQQFYAIVPPLTLSFVDNALASKEKLFKKNKQGAAFTDDGFAMGLAYVNALLDQSQELDSLRWFDTVSEHLEAEASAAALEARLDDEKLQQTRALTLDRLERRRAEFRLLYYSLSGARVFFKQPDS
ncbi:WASH complex subunit 4-like [Phymastichus coffea]|uniref:WASH complex subunit 4-like n=1 Tax=Phymastichus coffea TaxID=108790 RepID=UPI00273C5B24|nr:WASH complex subunit 4-like [Phymastichus coffea]